MWGEDDEIWFRDTFLKFDKTGVQSFGSRNCDAWQTLENKSDRSFETSATIQPGKQVVSQTTRGPDCTDITSSKLIFCKSNPSFPPGFFLSLFDKKFIIRQGCKIGTPCSSSFRLFVLTVKVRTPPPFLRLDYAAYGKKHYIRSRQFCDVRNV